MKKLLLACSLLLSVGVFAQSAKFKETEHSFGKIPQGKPVTTDFVFTNTSSKAIIVESAVAGCGCTTPVYPKAPIAKGKTGVIQVTYNAANIGSFTKDVTVKFVGETTPLVLNIKGEVEAGVKTETKAEAIKKAPRNAKLVPAK